MEINLPCLSEQKKIGEFFFKLDNLITLHQRKCDSLVKLKKALLQKMFPKNGESVPEIRFPGFSEPWEQRKLGDITDSFSGGTPTVRNKSFYGGEIPFIRSAEIKSSKTELYLTELGLKNSSAKMVKRGDILYALYGATSGETGLSKINGAINQAILAIRPHCKYNSEYLVQWLIKNKSNIISTFLQGGQGNLSAAIIKNLQINCPSLAEQVKIGNLFKKLDDSITLHQRKVQALQKLKKALLQQMFV